MYRFDVISIAYVKLFLIIFRLKKILKLTGNSKLASLTLKSIISNYGICNCHYDETQYIVKGEIKEIKWLLPNQVPRIGLPSAKVPDHLLDGIRQKRDDACKNYLFTLQIISLYIYIYC